MIFLQLVVFLAIGMEVSASLKECRDNGYCGFERYSETTGRPWKRIPGWCRCPSDKVCVFLLRDSTERMYKYGCDDKTGVDFPSATLFNRGTSDNAINEY